MKRILMLLSLLVLVLAISVSAAAEVVVSEDMQTIVVNEETYVRANVSKLGSSFYDTAFTVVPPQEAQFASVTAQRHTDNTEVLRLRFQYADGSEMTVTYIREDLLPVYEQLLTAGSYEVDFAFPVGNRITASRSALTGEKSFITYNEYNSAVTYKIYATDEGKNLKMRVGELVAWGDQFYFMDYAENGIDPYVTMNSGAGASVYKVTDATTLEQIKAAEEQIYGTDLGWLEDETLSEQLTVVLIVVVFGMLPLAALITFTVFAIRSKKKVYRVLNLIVCGCALAVLLVLLLLVLLF